MRFYKPEVGQTRIKSWFAFLPVYAEGEIRWLEKVTVKQKYYHYHYDNSSFWVNEQFINK